jgi:tRNA(fMet)-specific endonuclease VapC
MFLLDTNICIYLFRHQPPSVIRRFESLSFGDVVISSITLAELEHGIEKDPLVRLQRRNSLNKLLELLPVLDFDKKAAEAYGKLRATGQHLGRHRFDTLIAAHALSVPAILVTNNSKDFKGIDGLNIENWASGENL